MSEYYNHTFSDEEWEAIEEEADRLFRDSERRRGSIRGQVIQKEDHLHFWTAVAVQSRRAAPVVADDVAEDIVEAVGQLVGMSHGGWDMVDPAELCRAFFAEFEKLTYTGNPVSEQNQKDAAITAALGDGDG